jgi:ornithine cyclodeaminase/alanine dehydrogenase-like protein (mu-crystallin family)
MSATAEYLNEERLLRLLTPAAALEAVRAFFSAHRREDVRVPPRIHLPAPGRSTVGLYMPAATSSYIGVKIVHLMPERRPAVEAEVFLYDAETGKLLFWGDGKPLTGLRTAAVSLAATRELLPGCRSVVVFGGGVQAAAHLAAFASAYPELETLHAVTRSPPGFERLREQLSPDLRGRVARSDAGIVDLGGADCIVTTTPAGAPLFDWEAVPETCHIVAVGSATPAMNELPPEAFLASNVWVDTPVALEEAGDCLAAMKRGWQPEQALRGDLFDLLGRGATGQGVPEGGGRTLFKSVGHAGEDLAILVRLWESLGGGS